VTVLFPHPGTPYLNTHSLYDKVSTLKTAPAQLSLRCTKHNSRPVSGKCTDHQIHCCGVFDTIYDYCRDKSRMRGCVDNFI